MADSVCSSYYFSKRLGSGYHRPSSEAVSRYLHFSLCRTAVCVRSEVVSTAGWLINKQLWLFSKGCVFRNSSAVLQLTWVSCLNFNPWRFAEQEAHRCWPLTSEQLKVKCSRQDRNRKLQMVYLSQQFFPVCLFYIRDEPKPTPMKTEK